MRCVDIESLHQSLNCLVTDKDLRSIKFSGFMCNMYGINEYGRNIHAMIHYIDMTL